MPGEADYPLLLHNPVRCCPTQHPGDPAHGVPYPEGYLPQCPGGSARTAVPRRGQTPAQTDPVNAGSVSPVDRLGIP